MMLISVEELAARLDDPTLRLADVRWYVGEPERGRREYDCRERTRSPPLA